MTLSRFERVLDVRTGTLLVFIHDDGINALVLDEKKPAGERYRVMPLVGLTRA